MFDKSQQNLLKKEKLLRDWENLKIITPSQWIADLLRKTFLKNKDVYVIHNGINLDIFKPTSSSLRKKYGLTDKVILLGVASNWSFRKGLHYFINLNKIIDHQKYQIVLIGLSQKQMTSIPENIIAIHRTDTVSELVSWYSVADVLVYPSLADNFPTVILEALASGTPVVTFNTGGCWEAVGDECGVLVKGKTTEKLYLGIMECQKKDIAPEICVKKAQNYDRLKKYQEYEMLFQQLNRNF